MNWHEAAHHEVSDAERTYQLYTEFAEPDANIIGWLNSARRSLDQGYLSAASARAEQVRAEVYRLSIANGLVRADR